jgi:hypothetical protein
MAPCFTYPPWAKETEVDEGLIVAAAFVASAEELTTYPSVSSPIYRSRADAVGIVRHHDEPTVDASSTLNLGDQRIDQTPPQGPPQRPLGRCTVGVWSVIPTYPVGVHATGTETNDPAVRAQRGAERGR